jgi:hypothetical protein
MTDAQFDFLSMVEADLAILLQYNSIVTGNAKLAALVAAVTNTHSAILTTAGIQSGINKGPTKTKNNLWIDAATKADHVCSGVKSYADDVNDANLLAAMHYTYNSLIKDSTNQAIIDMQTIHDKAATIAIALLAPFNVIAAEITGLQTAINSFTAAAPMKRAMVANTSVATAQLTPMFTTQRMQLKKLDNIINTFRKSQATFVATHFDARKIINLGKTQQAEEVHLMPKHFEAIFGKKFLEGDTFTVRNHSEVDMEVFLTDVTDALPAKGGIKIPSKTDLKLAISKDFGGVFGHWLIVYNPNALDDVHVTVILAHGKSHSAAQTPGNVTT